MQDAAIINEATSAGAQFWAIIGSTIALLGGVWRLLKPLSDKQKAIEINIRAVENKVETNKAANEKLSIEIAILRKEVDKMKEQQETLGSGLTEFITKLNYLEKEISQLPMTLQNFKNDLQKIIRLEVNQKD